MPLPEQQLIEWSQAGESTEQRKTFAQIQQILTSPNSRINPKNCDIYIQGSCLNDTNIGPICDVDIVVQAKEMPAEPNVVQDLIVDLKEGILETLRDALSLDRIKVGKRALNILSTSGETLADILPCCRYVQIKDTLYPNQEPAEGIQFFTAKGEQETRFPKLHYQNGVLKNGRTNGNFKKMVRVFKNARLHLPDKTLMRKRAGSSYSIECLLYNVPDRKFHGTMQQCYVEVIDWLQKADMDSFLLQHEQDALFGPASEQWTIEKARTLIRAYTELWKLWK
jgi:hypothetical protein